MIISPDNLLYIDGIYVWTPERVGWAWMRSYELLEEAVLDSKHKRVVILCGAPGSGKSTWLAQQKDHEETIYFDAVLTHSKDRKRTLKRVAGLLPVDLIWVKADLSTCIKRNAKRPTERIVPLDRLIPMYEQLLRTPPKIEEGYRDLSIIRGE